MQFGDLLKLYHWNTHAYARHVASGELYDKFQKNLDKFVETFQKKDRIMVNSHIPIRIVSDIEIVEILNKFVDFLNELKLRKELEVIRDDIVIDVNQTLYLFSMD